MLKIAEGVNLYTIKCQHCGEYSNVTPLNWITLPYGFIMLTGEKDGYIGMTCPNPECLHTTLVNESLNELNALREELFEEAEYGPGYVKPLLRYRSFPYGFDYPGYLTEHLLGDHFREIDNSSQSMAESEVLYILAENDRIDFSGLYRPYAFNDLAMGPAIYITFLRSEGIGEIVKYENETKNRVFPRYMPYEEAIELTDKFCYSHFMKEVELENVREDFPELHPLGDDSLSRSHREADRNHAFFQILTTPAAQTRKRYEMLGSGPEDAEEELTSSRSMEHEVAAYYNKGLGKEFLEKRYLDFINKYMSISERVDFTAQETETLRLDYLAQLNQQMKTEILATKQYAFFEESKTWTIIFDSKRIPNLHGKGFRYLHYLVSHMRKEYSAAELAALDGIQNDDLPAKDRRYDDQSEDEAPQKRGNIKVKELPNPGLPQLKEEKMKLQEEKDVTEEELREAQAADDKGRQEMLNAKLDSIYEKIEKCEEIYAALFDPRKEAEKTNDRIAHNLKRALSQLTKANKTAGQHFFRALRKGKNYKKRRKFAKYESTLSYDPVEDIKWNLE
jgi:hypothetical protein